MAVKESAILSKVNARISPQIRAEAASLIFIFGRCICSSLHIHSNIPSPTTSVIGTSMRSPHSKLIGISQHHSVRKDTHIRRPPLLEADDPFAETSMAIVQESPLLKLAAELRNAIYSEVLIKPGVTRVQRLIMPPLVQTCRQVRADSLQLYYANNTFHVGDGSCDPQEFCDEQLLPWLRSIDVSAVKTLSKIRIDDKYYDYSEDASGALVMYTKGMVSAGYEVAREALFVEGRVFGHQGHIRETFWTSDPKVDFASAGARVTAEEVKGSTH
ncbi:hypothetical protein LTR56_019937 [Elasticomyces elasticus]|nr:hypothetical protein LTR56_019937 [Elasticomyces elasticus]KAK3643376.1 hypothetical protein LTR22_015679 [Elasticomyces elasticus]KAK4914004.1 hypothetical protein LTR49_017718 [Elasticomyces elasticus]KAK5755485.1 hypothetical protein LTS12_014470 [Elasticomyces elasticus]